MFANPGAGWGTRGLGIQPAAPDGIFRLPIPAPAAPAAARSVKPLHSLVVRVERGPGVCPGRVHLSHPLQLVAATSHEIQRDLQGRATAEPPAGAARDPRGTSPPSIPAPSPGSLSHPPADLLSAENPALPSQEDAQRGGK